MKRINRASAFWRKASSPTLIHAAGIGAYWHIDEVTQFAEFDDFISDVFDLFRREAKKETAHADVFKTRRLTIHTEHGIEQTGHFAFDGYVTAGWRIDTGEDAQQGGFPGTVMPDQGDAFTFADVNADVFQRFDFGKAFAEAV